MITIYISNTVTILSLRVILKPGSCHDGKKISARFHKELSTQLSNHPSIPLFPVYHLVSPYHHTSILLSFPTIPQTAFVYCLCCCLYCYCARVLYYHIYSIPSLLKFYCAPPGSHVGLPSPPLSLHSKQNRPDTST